MKALENLHMALSSDRSCINAICVLLGPRCSEDTEQQPLQVRNSLSNQILVLILCLASSTASAEWRPLHNGHSWWTRISLGHISLSVPSHLENTHGLWFHALSTVELKFKGLYAICSVLQRRLSGLHHLLFNHGGTQRWLPHSM